MIVVGMWTLCGFPPWTSPSLFDFLEGSAAGGAMGGRRRFRTADIRLVRDGLSRKSGQRMTVGVGA